MKTLVIIPAYNEAANIARVIADLRREFPSGDLLVVNDGSADDTGKQARATAAARVVDLPCNLGIGGAVQTGFIFAWRHGYDVALQFDGDGQHLAGEIPLLLEPLLQGEADVAIGSRFLCREGEFRSSPLRRIGIGLFYLLNSLIIGRRITDSTSGFRAYNRRAISFLAASYPCDFPEPEAVVLLGKNGFRIREVAVRMRPRQGGRSSISGFRGPYYMVKVLLAILVAALRPPSAREVNREPRH